MESQTIIESAVKQTNELPIVNGLYFMSPSDAHFLLQDISAVVMRSQYPVDNQDVYVCFGAKLQGLIHINEIKSITIDEFRQTYEKHKIRDITRELRWGRKEPLFMYSFDIKELFKPAKTYNYQHGHFTLVTNIRVEENGQS